MPANKSTTAIKKLSTAVIYLVALSLLSWAAYDVYLRVQGYQNSDDNSGSDSVNNDPTANKNSSASKIVNTRAVANQHIFGKPPVMQQEAAVTLAPATKLKLKLIGVIATQGDRASKVIIQIDGREVDVYSIGDKLPRGNATIEKIEATQVLLRRNGKLESLAIIRPELEENEEDTP